MKFANFFCKKNTLDANELDFQCSEKRQIFISNYNLEYICVYFERKRCFKISLKTVRNAKKIKSLSLSNMILWNSIALTSNVFIEIANTMK